MSSFDEVLDRGVVLFSVSRDLVPRNSQGRHYAIWQVFDARAWISCPKHVFCYLFRRNFYCSWRSSLSTRNVSLLIMYLPLKIFRSCHRVFSILMTVASWSYCECGVVLICEVSDIWAARGFSTRFLQDLRS